MRTSELDTTRSPDEESDRIERDYTVRAVERVCAVLNLLQESIDGVSLIDVAATTELPKSSAFRYLWTLERHRYVERNPGDGTYRLGLAFVGMQSRQLDVLRQRARPWMERVRDRFEETVNLGILDGDEVTYLEIIESRRGVRLAARRGDRDPIHATALGKVIAATLPEQRVRAILERSGMEPRTARTITTVDGYFEELAEVRRLGFAMDDGENEIDGRCVAVPIPGSPMPAALSLSAPSARFPLQDVENVVAALEEVAASAAVRREP